MKSGVLTCLVSTGTETPTANGEKPSSNGNEDSKLTMEHALQLYMDTDEQLGVVDTKLAATDIHTELALYHRLAQARATLVTKSASYYQLIKCLFRKGAYNAITLQAIADGKIQLYNGIDTTRCSNSITTPNPQSDLNLEVLGYTKSTKGQYDDQLPLKNGDRKAPAPILNNDDESAKPMVSKSIKPDELINKSTDRKVYSEKEILDNIYLLKQKKLSPKETQLFILDIIYQSQDSNKIERENILTNAVCAIEKEFYDTEYDVRHLIVDAILKLYKDDEDTLKSIRETRITRRISNWIRYEIKARNDNKIVTFLKFIKGLNFSEAQLNTVKLTDFLRSSSKKKFKYTPIAIEILDAAAEITAKEKAIIKAKIDEQNAKKAEEQRKLDLEQEQERREKEAKEKANTKISAPKKTFSFSNYVTNSKNVAATDKQYQQGNIVLHEPQHNHIPVEGLKSILKTNKEKLSKKRTVMFPDAIDELINIRYIEAREIDLNNTDIGSKAKEMIISEASLLKRKEETAEDEEIYIEEEGDIFWVTPMRINFSQFKSINLCELAETRGGKIKLITNEKSNALFFKSNEKSISPYEPAEGLITPELTFPQSDYSQVLSEETTDSIVSETIASTTTQEPSSNKNPDQDILDLLDDDLSLGNEKENFAIQNGKKRSIEPKDLFENKKPKINQSPSQQTPEFESSSQHFSQAGSQPLQPLQPSSSSASPLPHLLQPQQQFPQPNNTNYLPNNRKDYSMYLNLEFLPKGPSSLGDLLPNRTKYLDNYNNYQTNNNLDAKIKSSGNLPMPNKPISNKVMKLRRRDQRATVRAAPKSLVSKWTILCDYFNKPQGCNRGINCAYIHLDSNR